MVTLSSNSLNGVMNMGVTIRKRLHKIGVFTQSAHSEERTVTATGCS